MCQMGCIICADCESVIFVNRTHHCHTPLHVQLTNPTSFKFIQLFLYLFFGFGTIATVMCLLWGFLQSLHAHLIVHG